MSSGSNAENVDCQEWLTSRWRDSAIMSASTPNSSQSLLLTGRAWPRSLQPPDLSKGLSVALPEALPESLQSWPLQLAEDGGCSSGSRSCGTPKNPRYTSGRVPLPDPPLRIRTL